MWEFFQIGGYSMYTVLLCGLGGLVASIDAARRPAEARRLLAQRLATAVGCFAFAGLASNVAMTLVTVAERNPAGDGFRVMLTTGLYESTAPVIMGFSFMALIHVALAVAGVRESKLAA